MKRKANDLCAKMNAYKIMPYIFLVCIFLSAALLACGCTKKTADSKKGNEPTEVVTEEQNPPQSTPSDDTLEQEPTESDLEPEEEEPEKEEDLLKPLRRFLNKDFSFTVSSEYMHLAVNGITLQITQVTDKNGGWSFISQQKSWDHRTSYESLKTTEYYYCYEGSDLVAYYKIGEDDPRRAVISFTERMDLEIGRKQVVGVSVLLPDYLQNLTVTNTADATFFVFELPVDKVIADSTLLSAYVKNAFYYYGAEYKTEYNSVIICTIEADPETKEPKSASFDFSQIKPYVLSQGAISGEFALQLDLMTMNYTFNFDLAEATEIPDHMIP